MVPARRDGEFPAPDALKTALEKSGVRHLRLDPETRTIAFDEEGVELNFGAPRSTGGWPRRKADLGILERLAAMSEPLGTKIRIEDGVGIVEL